MKLEDCGRNIMEYGYVFNILPLSIDQRRGRHNRELYNRGYKRMYRLRELERKDLDRINVWRNDPELTASLVAPYRFINLEVDIRWYENYMRNRKNAVRCALIEEKNDRIIGLVSLVSIDYVNQSAEFHLMVGDSHDRGKGAGTYAVQKMLRHAFFNMNLHRIELTVLASNTAAIHLYEKNHFKYEGRKRMATYKNGKFVDMLIYSILKEEYEKSQILPEE